MLCVYILYAMLNIISFLKLGHDKINYASVTITIENNTM